jgi:hypothetical protein
VVGAKDAELQIAEIAGAAGGAARRLVLALREPVEAGEVEDGAGRVLLRHGDASRGQRLQGGRGAAGGVDDQVGAEFAGCAVGALDGEAGRRDRIAAAFQDRCADEDLGLQRHVGQPLHVAAHGQLDGGAAGDEGGQRGVFGSRPVARLGGGWDRGGEGDLLRAGFEQFGQQGGMLLGQQPLQPRQEAVAVAQMADAAARPMVERLVRSALGRRRIALDQGDLPARRRKRQGDKQPRHARAGHRHSFGHTGLALAPVPTPINAPVATEGKRHDLPLG